MNTRNLGHWLILLVIIGGIGGVVYGMHRLDANDKQEVATTNRKHAKQSRQAIKIAAAQSKAQRAGKVTTFDKKNSGSRTPIFTAKVNRDLKARRFVGTALVVKNDRVVYQKAFGYANAAKHRKNKVTTQYLINSIQKSLTGQLVMRAAQSGQLQLTDRLSQYYPQIKNSNKITIRQMLDMMGGVTGDMAPATTLTEKQVYQYAQQNAQINPKKINRFDYQPISYVLLAGILNQVTHESYYKLFYQQLVTPLDLNHTSFAQLWRTSAKRTVSYGGARPGQYQTAHTPAANDMAAQLATGNATMSAGDLFRAERAVIQGQLLTTPAGAQVLHQATTNLHYTGGMYHYDQTGYYGHGMGDYYESTFVMSKNGRTGVIFLSNSFEKKTMFPKWSTEQLAMDLFQEVNTTKKLA
ncbi:serine hydrolase domain-containing protein [Levilactobacillus zymae]|uniref:serine hydrolase domain-containing protein n=1 Tax=Levilactobacillus zymae TaxID=267363 RepID=UPI0028B39595|nr:serine hydrolase domain-containing protein [Levilactobacillus zymae]MDT6980019.1 serine hydrolase domain-containing protein [Levilactobacillus zymae]